MRFRGRGPLRLFVNALFVAEGHRGQGVGSALLAEAVRRATSELFVYTDLRGWYEARGFAFVERDAESGSVLLRCAPS